MLYLLVKRKVFLEMALQSERSLDQTDWKILRELQQDGRLSYNELGRRVGLSAPATAERVRKLEDADIITSYGAQVDVAKLGLPLLAFIQLRCFPDRKARSSFQACSIPPPILSSTLSWSRNAWNAMLPSWGANRSSPERTAALPPSQAH
jgi:Lrp/AsnC family transcriptional regulator, leucine-responsive regulatory protein